MTRYKQIIISCEREVNTLHQMVWTTFESRNKTKQHHERWVRAAHDFRNHQSPIDDLINQSMKANLEHDPELRQFVFSYIEQDPYFFRSGYILESLLPRVKKLTFTNIEKDIVRKTILRRIETKALRNFRHLCRLIPLIDSEQFRYELRARAMSNDPNQRRRANFALSYLSHCKALVSE